MSEPEPHAQKIACRGYVFDDFTLDLDRGCLWRAGQEIKLRYKSFEALKYLVERSGRVVGKEEMMRAFWNHAGRLQCAPAPAPGCGSRKFYSTGAAEFRDRPH